MHSFAWFSMNGFIIKVVLKLSIQKPYVVLNIEYKFNIIDFYVMYLKHV
jgi:hypothetical protein